MAAAYNFRMLRRPVFSALFLLAVLGPVRGMAAEGAGGLCLFELPDDGSGKRRLINLTIVQFVEVGKDEVKIVYGGGALGSGYEARVPLKSPEEGNAILDRLYKTASGCR